MNKKKREKKAEERAHGAVISLFCIIIKVLFVFESFTHRWHT